MWFPHDVGRESWEWDGQESVVWQVPTPPGRGKYPSQEKARWRVDKVIVVVAVVLLFMCSCLLTKFVVTCRRFVVVLCPCHFVIVLNSHPYYE